MLYNLLHQNQQTRSRQPRTPMGSATKHSEDTPLLGSINHNDERIGRLQMSGPTSSDIIDTKQGAPQEEQDDLRSTIASVAGNVLELYDFAIYGYFSDIIGYNFFPPSNDESTAIIESFLVFGGAFFVVRTTAYSLLLLKYAIQLSNLHAATSWRSSHGLCRRYI